MRQPPLPDPSFAYNLCVWDINELFVCEISMSCLCVRYQRVVCVWEISTTCLCGRNINKSRPEWLERLHLLAPWLVIESNLPFGLCGICLSLSSVCTLHPHSCFRFEFARQNTEESEFLHMVDFGDERLLSGKYHAKIPCNREVSTHPKVLQNTPKSDAKYKVLQHTPLQESVEMF